MYCPQCGYERVSEETNYCSKCGFLLTSAAELVRNAGVAPGFAATPGTGMSARRRGIKHGLFWMLLTFLVVPLVGALSMAFGFDPSLAGAASILFFMGGILRMVYAVMFESAEPGTATLEDKVISRTGSKNVLSAAPAALPPAYTQPAAQYMKPASGNWRDTNDLQPVSVTENTTKLLADDDRS